MRNLRPLVLAAAAVLALAASPAHPKDAAAPEAVSIPVAGSAAALAADVHRPATPNGVAVVLAPGQKYSRDKKLMLRSAEALAEAGFVALRFDWRYFTADPKAGAPSDDLAAEVADADAAVAHARKLPGVTKVILAGKSLGSVVAVRWSNAHPADLAGLALLTLPVSNPEKPSEPYDPDLGAERLALEPLIVCGDADPLADRAALYRLAASMPKTPRVVIVPGGHSFDGPTKDAEEQAENVELAVRSLVVWARRVAAR